MENELIKLYNTLALIETKGENSILMGDCLKFLKGLIAESQEKKDVAVEEKE